MFNRQTQSDKTANKAIFGSKRQHLLAGTVPASQSHLNNQLLKLGHVSAVHEKRCSNVFLLLLEEMRRPVS